MGKVLATQACGPEFTSQHPCAGPSKEIQYCNPSAEKVVTGSLEFTGKLDSTKSQ